MPDETRVFDVTRPGRSSPDASSKPIIVGHHPTMNDPMMRDEASPAAPTRIAVQDSAPDEPSPNPQDFGSGSVHPSAETAEFSPAGFHDAGVPSEETPAPDAASPNMPSEPMVPTPESYTDTVFSTEHDQTPVEPPSHIDGLHVGSPSKSGGRLKPAVLILILLLLGAYLAIDSGLIKTSVKMPVHIFKQKTTTPPAVTTPQASQNQAAVTALPPGFTEYKLADTNITFAAPTTWGQPTSTPDPGFSARGGTNKSDGIYAYLVNFGTNKDVEVAVTSSKYLPAARGTLYYDALQWCVGTNDSKIYLTILHFSTANKIDTPTTTTCDQGPLAGATKLNSTTIVQLAAKGADAKVLGDFYTKNLANAALPVFRVKDTAMTNGDNIKQLLDTVKAPAAATSTGSSTP